MSNPGARAKVCFASAELAFNNNEREVGCACYLEGLRILLEESKGIRPLEYFELVLKEQFVLFEYIVPKSPPCSSPSSLLS